MSTLIKNGTIVTSEFDANANTIPTLEALLSNQEKGATVLLEAGEEVESLSAYLDGLTMIALDFPAFTDGRAYSSANILRRTYKFEGEIRAVGDVRVDQLEQMVRCGFNAFVLPETQDADLAITRLSVFPYSYQATIDTQPIFAQRS